MSVKTLVVLLSSYLAFVAASVRLEQCHNGTVANLNEVVQVSPCKKTPCTMKRGTTYNVSIKFTPKKDIKDITLDVKGIILGLPLPFIGIDGNSACKKIQDEAGQNVSCPLKANTNYVYKDSFPILHIYPTVDVKVHYALKDKNRDIVCFELPSRITQ